MSNAKYVIVQAKFNALYFFYNFPKYLEQLKSMVIAFFNKSSNVYASHNSLSINKDLILFPFFCRCRPCKTSFQILSSVAEDVSRLIPPCVAHILCISTSNVRIFLIFAKLCILQSCFPEV